MNVINLDIKLEPQVQDIAKQIEYAGMGTLELLGMDGGAGGLRVHGSGGSTV